MPRYFFHVRDGKDIEDTEGTVLSDDPDARKQAITTAAEIIRSEATALVTDEGGRCMLTLRFSAEDHPATV